MQNFSIQNACDFQEIHKLISNLAHEEMIDCKLYYIYDEDYSNPEEWNKIKHLALELEEGVELVDYYWDFNDDYDTHAEYPEVLVHHYNKKALDLLGIKYSIFD